MVRGWRNDSFPQREWRKQRLYYLGDECRRQQVTSRSCPRNATSFAILRSVDGGRKILLVFGMPKRRVQSVGNARNVELVPADKPGACATDPRTRFTASFDPSANRLAGVRVQLTIASRIEEDRSKDEWLSFFNADS